MITPNLKRDIQEFLDEAEEEGSCGSALTLAATAAALFQDVLKEPVEDFPIGTHVRHMTDGEYLGTVTRVIRFYEVRDAKGAFIGEYTPTSLEVAPELDDQTVWSEVPLLVMRYIQTQGTVVYSFDREEIRRECYKLLGGHGVEITPEVKERVRDIIKQTASVMHVLMVGTD